MTTLKKYFMGLIAALLVAAPAYAAGEPQNVSGVTATPVDSASVSVSWNAASDALGGLVKNYRIYYGTTSVQTVGSGDYASQLDTPDNKTTFVVSGLTADSTYYFSVTALDNSGVESDSYSLEASAKTAAAAMTTSADTTSPAVASVSAPDKKHVKVVFSEGVKVPELLPETAFAITEQVNTSNALMVTKAEVDAADATGKTVLLETADQSANTNYVVTVGVAVTDAAGNPMVSGSFDTGLFLGSANEPGEAALQPAADETTEVTADTTPPEDVTGFILDFKANLDKFVILLDWTASANSAKDLVSQMLYMSLDRGTSYDAGRDLGPASTHAEINDLEGGKEYTFKLTTKDAAGNESVGAVKSIRLPQTGVGLGLVLLGSAASAHMALRRKKKQEEQF